MASSDQIKAFAKELVSREEFQDILKLLKAETIQLWANGSDSSDKREQQYRDMQAIGRLEARIRGLKDDVTVDERKAKEAKK